MNKILFTFVFSIYIAYSAKCVNPLWAWQHNFSGPVSTIEYHNDKLCEPEYWRK